MQIDAHQHFWRYSAREYPWIDPEKMSPLARDFLPEHLRAEQTKVGFDGSIVVQAQQTLEEAKWLLELANMNPRVKGVVGWVDLQSDKVDEQLSQFASHPKFVGVRHVVQDEPDDQFILGEKFLRGIGRLKQFDLTYDILIYPKQLLPAIQMVRQFPEQPFVLDHIAKPHIKDAAIAPWDARIRRLAEFPNVYCKVSGMVTEADWTEWKDSDFRPYLDVIVDAFGEDRLMVGSDWPVCKLAASYEQVVGIAKDYFKSFSKTAQKKIFGENALKFYGLAK